MEYWMGREAPSASKKAHRVRDNKHRLLTSVWMASASTYPDMSSTAFTQPLQIDFMRKILGKEPRIDFRNFAPMAYVKA
ncbi:uncharacterized protein LOC112873574 isoform X2 [Panicum hallii]|uniref:uncharacterized protein LOC112873574 isoform X2 n=1 Tax=Panicum hallii TaxID=206008 RepID=UPI000DF4D4A0|nr:uncharacterized protein LOC112873574 isoform X2 [Panicum hallii]